MPSTANLLLPHVESAQAQKEVTLNEALDYLDGALTAQLSKSVAAADVTLTDDEATQTLYLKATGLQTTNRSIVVPDRRKLWIVERAATGAYTVTVKTLAGAGVALSGAEVRLIYCDGTTCIAVTPATIASEPFDIAGYIPGLPGDGAVILRFVASRALQVPAALANSQGLVGTAPTAPADFSLRKNGVQFGLASFAAAATTCTFTAATATDFVAGDLLSIVAPSPQDATLAELAITLASVRI
jgi:hypothetical protein